MDEWVEAKKQNRNKPLRPASVESIQNMANDFKRAFGEDRIKQITRNRVEEWLNGLAIKRQTRGHKRN